MILWYVPDTLGPGIWFHQSSLSSCQDADRHCSALYSSCPGQRSIGGKGFIPDTPAILICNHSSRKGTFSCLVYSKHRSCLVWCPPPHLYRPATKDTERVFSPFVLLLYSPDNLSFFRLNGD